jgi:uncharacterized membrane protein YfcA
MGLPSAVGAFIGIQLMGRLDPSWGRLFIGLALLLTGFKMAVSKDEEAREHFLPPRLVLLGEILVGLGLGVVSGVIGLMLGSLRLPAMIRVLRIDPGVAVGSNMAIGAVTAVAAAVLAVVSGQGHLDWRALLIVGPLTVLGGYLGARLTGTVSPAALKRIIGWTIGLGGVAMLGEALFRLARLA